jgi:hypothetical protein
MIFFPEASFSRGNSSAKQVAVTNKKFRFSHKKKHGDNIEQVNMIRLMRANKKMKLILQSDYKKKFICCTKESKEEKIPC